MNKIKLLIILLLIISCQEREANIYCPQNFKQETFFKYHNYSLSFKSNKHPKWIYGNWNTPYESNLYRSVDISISDNEIKLFFQDTTQFPVFDVFLQKKKCQIQTIKKYSIVYLIWMDNNKKIQFEFTKVKDLGGTSKKAILFGAYVISGHSKTRLTSGFMLENNMDKTIN